MHHRHCRGSCRVPGIDRSHSGRPSAAIQQHTAGTSCHHCTRLHHSRCTHDELHSAACLQHTRHTDGLCSRRASCRSHYSSCIQWHPTRSRARTLAHSPRIDDRPTSTDPRMRRSPCAGCWALDQPRIGCMVSRRRCTKTSPSAIGTTRTPSCRHSADCPHHTAHTHLQSQIRARFRWQSMAGIRCDS